MAFAAGGYQVQCCGDINHFNEETRTRVSEAVPAEGQMGEIELEGLGVTPRPALQGLSLCSCAVCTIYCVFFFLNTSWEPSTMYLVMAAHCAFT